MGEGGGLKPWVYGYPTSLSASIMAQTIQLFGPREGFLTHQWIITGKKKDEDSTETCCDLLINVICLFSIIWCSESAHLYDHIVCGCVSEHFKLISAVRVHAFGKKIHVHVLRKGQFCFTLCNIRTLLEHLNIKSLHMYVQYLHVHTRDVPAPVA